MKAHLSPQSISEWLDGQMGEQDAARVELHLAQCEDCRALEAEMTAVNRLFQKAQPLTPPPFLWTRIAAELQTTSAETRSQSPSVSWLQILVGHDGRLSWFRTLVPASLLLVLVISGSLAVREYRSETRIRLAAIAEIDRAHLSLVEGNLPTSNPFRVATGTDLERNPFSRSGKERDPNPFRQPLGEKAAEGFK